SLHIAVDFPADLRDTCHRAFSLWVCVPNNGRGLRMELTVRLEAVGAPDPAARRPGRRRQIRWESGGGQRASSGGHPRPVTESPAAGGGGGGAGAAAPDWAGGGCGG